MIVSESSFHPDTDIPAKKHGRAGGLMQITDSTMTALSNHHGELSNYLICFEHLKLFNPTANICCGVRWLFRKKITASVTLGRQATWIEAVADYKGILKNLPHKWYEKGDYDPDKKIIHGSPYIQVKADSTTVYEYALRRDFSLDYARDKVRRWQKLMKDQQFVCIGGYFVRTNEKKISEQLWVFENLKTKKGCDSYFSGWCS